MFSFLCKFYFILTKPAKLSEPKTIRYTDDSFSLTVGVFLSIMLSLFVSPWRSFLSRASPADFVESF